MENPVHNNLLIELHVPDFKKVKEYYGRLGFEVVWERKPEELKGYPVMKTGNNILCFWAGNEYAYKHPYFQKWPQGTKKGYAVEIVVMVDDVESYYEKVGGFAKVVEPLKEQPWGLKDFRIEDPFGFYLRITEPYDTLDSKYAVP